MPTPADAALSIQIDPEEVGTVYLSVSWKNDDGKLIGSRIMRHLDEQGFLVIGDVHGQKTMPPKRIERIMATADGFLVVFPHRADDAELTSTYVIQELELAVVRRLPIGLMLDRRIQCGLSDDPAKNAMVLTFVSGRKVEIPKALWGAHASFDFGDDHSESKAILEMKALLERSKKSAARNPPYAFLISRLQPDFEGARNALVSAAERASGIRCIHLDSPGYTTSVDDTPERAMHLIKHAAFVVADMSLDEAGNASDNANRAHELGIARAYGKQIFVTSHLPRRNLHHGIAVSQVTWWSDEESLHEGLFMAVDAKRAAVGRQVYNRKLPAAEARVHPLMHTNPFELGAAPRWKPPLSMQDHSWRGWVLALCLGASVLCASSLLNQLFRFDGTLDFASCMAGILAFVFASQWNDRLRSILLRESWLAFWTIVGATVLLGATVFAVKIASAVDTQRTETSTSTPPLEQGATKAPESTAPVPSDKHE